MTQSHSNTTKRTFTHLTDTERGEIAAYKAMGLSLREIGLKIGRNASHVNSNVDLLNKSIRTESLLPPIIQIPELVFIKRTGKIAAPIPLLWRHGDL
jgi:hypothetical protein